MTAGQAPEQRHEGDREALLQIVTDIGTYMIGASVEAVVGVRPEPWVDDAAAEALDQWLLPFLAARDAQVRAEERERIALLFATATLGRGIEHYTETDDFPLMVVPVNIGYQLFSEAEINSAIDRAARIARQAEQ